MNLERIRRIAVLLLLLLIVSTRDSLADGLTGILSSDRIQNTLIRWVPGDTADDPTETNLTRTYKIGVIGGIDSHNYGRSIIQVPAPSGGDDSSVIQNIINSASENSIIQLQAGTYRIDSGISAGEHPKSNITIRGAGISQTILDCRRAGSICVSIDGTFQNPPYKTDLITAGVAKGSNKITLGDVSGYSVGELIQVVTKNDTTLPVVSVVGFRDQRYQLTKIENVDSNSKTLTIRPAIMANFLPNDTYTRKVFGTVLRNNGIEDLSIDGTQAPVKPGAGIHMVVNEGSWIKNVEIKGVSNYPIQMYDDLNCEVRHSNILPTTKALVSTNGAGILLHDTTATLFEDNIAFNLFPLIEINDSSMGNVFAYNFLYGGHLNTNHGTHNSYNLFEGNVANGFNSDGYFGGESEGTIFRNRILSYISNKRFTRNYNILGNILSTKEYAASSAGHKIGLVPEGLFESILGISTGDAAFQWLVDHGFLTTCLNSNECRSLSGRFYVSDLTQIEAALSAGGNQFGSQVHEIMAVLERSVPIYEFGRPNIGNATFDGFAQPSKGIYWKEWNPNLNPQFNGVTSIANVVDRDSVMPDGTTHYFTLSIPDSETNQRLYSYAHNACWQFDITDITHPSICQDAFGIDWGGHDGFTGVRVIAYDVNNSKMYLTGTLPSGVTQVGIWPHAPGFQEFDLDVDATTVLKANWLADANGGGRILSNEAISGSLPASLFRTAKPNFWPTGLAWPPINAQATTPNTNLDAIPAGQRFIQTGHCGATAHSCDGGTVSNIHDSADFALWNCSGSNGYPSEDCSSTRSVDDGICNNSVIYSCINGTVNRESSDSHGFIWSCQGPNGAKNASCFYSNRAPTLVSFTQTASGPISEYSSKTFTLVATDDHLISSVALFNSINGTLTPLPSQDIVVTSTTQSGGNEWTLSLTWTPKLAGTYNLVAKAVDDIGAVSSNSSTALVATVTTNSNLAPILQITPTKPILSGNSFTINVLNHYNTQSGKAANFVVSKIIFLIRKSTDSTSQVIAEVAVPSDYQSGQASISATTPPLSDGTYTLEATADSIYRGVPTLFKSQLTRIVIAKSLNNEPELIAWWKFNDGSGVTAHDSAFHQILSNGTISGAEWIDDTRNGETVKGLYFDGADSVTASLNITPYSIPAYPITACAWIKPVASGGGTKSVISTLGFVLGTQSNGILGSGSKYLLNLYNGRDSAWSEYDALHSDIWQHICGVVSAKHLGDELYSAKIYVNGLEVGASSSFTEFASSGGVTIGQGFVGTISDVRIYSRELSSSELGTLYQMPPPVLSKPSRPQNLRVIQ